MARTATELTITIPDGAPAGSILSIPVRDRAETIKARVPEGLGPGATLVLTRQEGSDVWVVGDGAEGSVQDVTIEGTDAGLFGAADAPHQARQDLARPDPSLVPEGPVAYTVRLDTTVGVIDLIIRPDWAPYGARRFLELAQAGALDGLSFYRAVRGCLAQFGLPARGQWPPLPDDPQTGVPFLLGAVCFAAAGPNSRKASVFICIGDMSHCLGQNSWETPIGAVAEQSLDALDRIETCYGDIAECDGPGPDAGRLSREGDAYLRADFPGLTYIRTAAPLDWPPAAEGEHGPSQAAAPPAAGDSPRAAPPAAGAQAAGRAQAALAAARAARAQAEQAAEVAREAEEAARRAEALAAAAQCADGQQAEEAAGRAEALAAAAQPAGGPQATRSASGPGGGPVDVQVEVVPRALQGCRSGRDVQVEALGSRQRSLVPLAPGVPGARPLGSLSGSRGATPAMGGAAAPLGPGPAACGGAASALQQCDARGRYPHPLGTVSPLAGPAGGLLQPLRPTGARPAWAAAAAGSAPAPPGGAPAGPPLAAACAGSPQRPLGTLGSPRVLPGASFPPLVSGASFPPLNLSLQMTTTALAGPPSPSPLGSAFCLGPAAQMVPGPPSPMGHAARMAQMPWTPQ